MQVVCNPKGTIPQLNRPAQGVIDMQKAGFVSAVLDIGMACDRWEFKNMSGRKKTAVAEKRPFIPDQPEAIFSVMDAYIAECRKRGIELPIAETPTVLRDRKSDELNSIYRRIAEETIRLAVREDCEAVIVRPLFIGISAERSWDVNREFYLSLISLVGDSDIKILLENQCKEYEGHDIRGICSDPYEAADWVDELNAACGRDAFGFCMNVGNYNLCGQDMYECATILNRRADAVIVRDCNGNQEASMLPFTAVLGNFQTDWLGLIRGLREIAFDGWLLFEAEDTLAPLSQLLRPQFLATEKAVADFFVWQIGLEETIRKYPQIVLFGAGNMCLNYLNNYGDRFPPLFTCDNNASRWGENFHGLTIHDPKDLLNLPDGTAIFICNMFYREIEEQLREMGVKNPIEYFNDEYLPIINMDRLRGL